MKLHLKRKYYKHTKSGREPIRFHVTQPEGIGTDIYGTIWLDPVLRKRANADLRKALIKHETDEIKAWGRGKSGVHTKAKSKEPKLIREIGGVSGFWREIERRNKEGHIAKVALGERAIPTRFDPKTMRRDKDNPKIIYISTMECSESVAIPDTGHILIGTKDKPSKDKIAEVIQHEKSHLGRRNIPMVGIESLDRLSIIRNELRGYNQERKTTSAKDWNKVLPSRIKQFMGYLTWVSKANQEKVKAQAKQALAPKMGGGNEQAICQAKADLARWWLEEEKPPTKCQAVIVRRSVKDIERELQRMTKGAHDPEARIKPGVAYTSSGRLSRKHHKGWRRVKYT
jgi:hypothetical protein